MIDEVVWNEDDGDEDDEDDDEEEEMEEGDSDDEDGEGSGDEESVSGGSEQDEEQGSDEEGDEEEEEEVDGESEGEWVDVSDDEEGGDSGSDEEQEDGSEEEEEENEGTGKRKRDATEAEAEPQTAQQRSKKLNSIRGRVDARRVLTEADFALLEKLRAAQAERLLDPRNRSRKSGLLGDSSAALKRKREEDDIEEGAAATAAYSVDASALAPGTRAEKTSKIDRIMHVLDGRKDAKRFEHEGHAGGLTNKEKLRKKNFVMVRKGKRAVTHKLRKSNSQVRHDKRESVRQKHQLVARFCVCWISS